MKLHYKEMGQGQPLIILHGLFGTLDNWQTLARQLAEHYLLFLPDQRNHGRSPDTEEFSYDLLAEDLYEFMNSHWIHKAHIVGHSMGGKVAMHFAGLHEDMVEKLVVIDIGPKAYPGGHEEIFKALMSIDLTQVSERKQVENRLRDTIRQEGIIQFLMKNLSRHQDGTFAWKMNLASLYRHYPDILAPVFPEHPVRVPARFIRGEFSPYVADSDWPEIRTFFPEAELLTIPGAGHWVHADQPQALLQTLQEFLG